MFGASFGAPLSPGAEPTGDQAAVSGGTAQSSRRDAAGAGPGQGHAGRAGGKDSSRLLLSHYY